MRFGLLLAGVFLLLLGCQPRLLPPHETPPDLTTLPRLGGVLDSDRQLSGTLLLNGDLRVPAGRTLRILPGTTIYVQVSDSTKIAPEFLSQGVELLVQGSLLIEGSAERPVRFLPVPTPEPGASGWAGILLDGASATRIVHAEIRQAETGILCLDASPHIEANTISGCRYGIIAQGQSAPRILDNWIHGGEGGVFCWWGARPALKGNRIEGNAEEGIYVDHASRPYLDRNQVRSNGYGLVLGPRDLPFDPTGISGNGEDLRYLASPEGQP